MRHLTRGLSFLVALGLFATSIVAGPLDKRIQQRFPGAETGIAAPAIRTAVTIDGQRVEGREVAATRNGVGAFFPDDYRDSMTLRSDAQSIALRPTAVRSTSVQNGANGSSYLRVRSGLDVLRSVERGVVHERLLIGSHAALQTLEYEIVATDGVAAIVRDGRGLRLARFGPGASLALGAPTVIDASGKPSHLARWEANGDTIRLKVDDRKLRYPLLIDATIASSIRNSTPEPRLRVRTESHGGTITGRLTDATTGAGIPDQLVHAYDTAGEYVASAISGAGGIYTFDLAPATYTVLAIPYEYEAQLYNGIPCPNQTCNVTTGNPLVVTLGGSITGIDFALTSNAARVSGRVTNATTHAPLANLVVALYDAFGNRSGEAFTDSNGEYVASLSAPGNYFARTLNFIYEGYVDQLYDGIDCTGCDVTTGTAIATSIGTLVEDVDFALDPDGGRISGRLTDAASNDGIGFQDVYITTPSGANVTFGTTDGNGNYTSFNGLATGSYAAYAQPAGYLAEVYDDVPCPLGDCSGVTGTSIAVTQGSTTNGIDFALASALSRITGSVTNDDGSMPLGAVQVTIYDASGTQVTTDFTNEHGDYSIVVPEAGTYYARTFASISYPAYIDEVYQNIPCSTCNVTIGTPIPVTAGQTTPDIDFALDDNGGAISGRVVDGNGDPIANATVAIYDASGNSTTYGITDANGDYTSIHALQAGTYYAITSPFGYAGEIYNNVSCPDGECGIGGGTPITVTLGTTTPNINFSLTSNVARISGFVLDSVTNIGIAADVVFYDAAGNFAAVTSTNPSDGTFEAVVPSTGNYFARTFHYSGIYDDELYDNISCASGCTITTGTPISATVGSTTINIAFYLTRTACPFIGIEPGTLPGGTSGDAYSQALNTTGDAVPPLTWSITAGALPAGLSLGSSSGVISGTLSTPGTYTFTVGVMDATGCTGTRDYTIDVVPAPPTITSVSPASGPVAGGQSVTITGTSLSTVAEVTFDGADATIVTVTDTSIVVLTPPHAGGLVDVRVATAGGNVTASNAYRYTNQPTVTLTSSPNPSVYGSSVTFTATLSESSATGSVQFFDGATSLGSSPVVSGVATLSTSALNAGSHTITAVYGGDGTFDPSTSNSLVQVVQKATRTITLTSSANPSVVNTSVTFTATVSPFAGASSVVFRDGATTLATRPINGSGVATFTTSSLTLGTHPITASTVATANFEAATSPVLNQVVKKPTPVFSDLTSATITLGYPTVLASGKITYGSSAPSGTVTISVGSFSTTAVILPGGSFLAALLTTNLPVGTHTITYSYAGNATYGPATGTSTLQVTYGITLTQYTPIRFAGSTITTRLRITNFASLNQSSPSIAVTVVGYRLASSSTYTPLTGTFSYESGLLGGNYRYDWNTSGLPSGSYVFAYRVQGDPVIHTINFTLL